MTPAVTIVIVNYNTGPALRACLASAISDLGDVDWTAVVVDNASTDGSLDELDTSARIVVLSNAVNVGFGAAVNQAARHHSAPLLWLLNPDCVVRPGTVSTLWRTMQAHPTCAIAGPQLLNADGSTQQSARGEPTPWTGLFGRHGLITRFFPNSAGSQANLRARALVAGGAESAEVDWVMGAAMLIRRDRFDAVGGFDERFFLYWEDADLCHRLRERGESVRFVPAGLVEHVGGQSSKTAQRIAVRAFHKSAYLYYATHIVRSPWHPGRWFAWTALTLRAWWRG
jgi:N-acetylglucosaminyl-diphospho-decaprenol L-rhamnosyltransferase